MSRGRIWIERDFKGDPSFVREKVHGSSFYDIFANALDFVKDRSLSLCKPRFIPTPVRLPLALPEPSRKPDPASSNMDHPPNTNESGALVHPDGQGHVQDCPPGMQQLAPYGYSGHDQGHYHYAAPPGFSAPIPYPVPYPVPAPIPVASAIEMKYRCSICGKYRSPQYHYRHPLLPGQEPAPTVCRKCRRSRTPSTDEYETSPRVVRRRVYYRSDGSRTFEEALTESEGERWPRRRASRVRVLSRSRSRSRDSLYYHSRRSYPRRSESSCFEAIRRRPRSPSVERVTRRVIYRDDPPVRYVRPKETKTYVVDRRRRIVSESSDFEYETRR